MSTHRTVAEDLRESHSLSPPTAQPSRLEVPREIRTGAELMEPKFLHEQVIEKPEPLVQQVEKQTVPEAIASPTLAPAVEQTAVEAELVEPSPIQRQLLRDKAKIVIHHGTLKGLEPIRSVSERSAPEFYDSNVPHILAFSNGFEQLEPAHLSFEKQPEIVLPNWLTGVYFFLGPGLFDVEYVHRTKLTLSCFTFTKWTDGLALLNRFFVDTTSPGDPKVVFRSRYTSHLQHRTRTYAQLYSLESDSRPNDWLISHLNEQNWNPSVADVNANMNLLVAGPGWGEKPASEVMITDESRRDSHLLATGKYSLVQELDMVTLLPKRTRSYYQINNDFKGILISNPVRDPVQKETFQVVMNPGMKATYTIFSILDEDLFEPPGHVVCKIKAPPSLKFHLGVTRNFVVLIIHPYTAGVMNWKLGLRDSFVNSLKFDSTSETQFHVIDRPKRSRVAVFNSQAFYAKSVLNIFEENQSIYIDMNCYETDLIEYCMFLQNIRKLGMAPFPDATVRRFALPRISTSAGKKDVKANFTHMTDFSLEFGSSAGIVDSKRYAYGLSFTPESVSQMNQIWDCISRADFLNKTRVSWSQDGCFPGPPVSVASPDKNSEIVLTIVLDSNRQRSFLLFLDGYQMKEIARVWLPHPIPFYSSGLKQPQDHLTTIHPSITAL